MTRNSSRDFSVASDAVGGTSIGNTVFILSTGGAVQAFDASGTGVPIRKTALDFTGTSGTTIVGQSSSTSALNGVWIGSSSGSMSFYKITDVASGERILEAIDTIFYTDKDRHKIYPQKCWIVGRGPATKRITGGDLFDRDYPVPSGWTRITILAPGTRTHYRGTEGNPTLFGGANYTSNAIFILLNIGITIDQQNDIGNRLNNSLGFVEVETF